MKEWLQSFLSSCPLPSSCSSLTKKCRLRGRRALFSSKRHSGYTPDSPPDVLRQLHSSRKDKLQLSFLNGLHSTRLFYASSRTFAAQPIYVDGFAHMLESHSLPRLSQSSSLPRILFFASCSISNKTEASTCSSFWFCTIVPRYDFTRILWIRKI